jgi:hypothetical protein
MKSHVLRSIGNMLARQPAQLLWRRQVLHLGHQSQHPARESMARRRLFDGRWAHPGAAVDQAPLQLLLDARKLTLHFCWCILVYVATWCQRGCCSPSVNLSMLSLPLSWKILASCGGDTSILSDYILQFIHKNLLLAVSFMLFFFLSSW